MDFKQTATIANKSKQTAETVNVNKQLKLVNMKTAKTDKNKQIATKCKQIVQNVNKHKKLNANVNKQL